MKIERDTIVRITLSSDDIKAAIREWVRTRWGYEIIFKDGKPVMKCEIQNDIACITYKTKQSDKEFKP